MRPPGKGYANPREAQVLEGIEPQLLLSVTLTLPQCCVAGTLPRQPALR